MLSECCDEYKLIQLYQKSSVWCFASSHTSTFELISSVATAQPGVMVTIGAEYGSFPEQLAENTGLSQLISSVATAQPGVMVTVVKFRVICGQWRWQWCWLF